MTTSVDSFLVVSLDFELYWGIRDHVSLRDCRDRLLGVRTALPAILTMFERFGIHATWATVGMLFCSTRRELRDALPSRIPEYTNARLSPYRALDEVGDDEKADPFHFAPSLVERIRGTPGQELGTHTFSHFYCLEPGQTAHDFDADLEAASRVGGEMKSIVFPRNQWNRSYDHILRKHGIRALRSNGGHWAYSPSAKQSFGRRGFRFLDAYAPLRSTSGRIEALNGVAEVPASAFLRPYSPWLRAFEPLRLERLMRQMTKTATRGGLFHLWWHPHNFGNNTRENLAVLEALLDHFSVLRKRHRFQSVSMAEAADLVALE